LTDDVQDGVNCLKVVDNLANGNFGKAGLNADWSSKNRFTFLMKELATAIRWKLEFLCLLVVVFLVDFLETISSVERISVPFSAFTNNDSASWATVASFYVVGIDAATTHFSHV
jgi:hypothetical protein